MLKIKIAEEFSDSVGTRYISEGEYSGEEFRESLLKPKFKEAVEKECKLTVDFDGGYGYPTSFLEEAFGGLVRNSTYGKKDILSRLDFISEDETSLIDTIKEYINNA